MAYRIVCFLLANICLIPLCPAVGSADTPADKTLAPYFFIADQEGDRNLPLQHTEVQVEIAGVLAEVRSVQTYKNLGARPIEAVYVFPGSTRSAVQALNIQIGDRKLAAQLKERSEARTQYAAARDNGQRSALLEQERPNVFRMNVANILPGEEVQVELLYSELLVPTNGVYEFIYPTVVGPRYSNRNAALVPASENWVANPYLHQNDASDMGFDIQLKLSAGMPIHELRSPSHELDIHFVSKESAEASLKFPGREGNRDFILEYRLSGAEIQTGLLTEQGGTEQFFLALIEPPARVTQTQILPREYTFVLDVSGSMAGFPLQVSKELMRNLLSKLSAADTFNVLTFSAGSDLFSPRPVPADKAHIDQALSFVDSQHGSGGTELLSALKRAFSADSGVERSRSIILLSDGYVDVEKDVFDYVRMNLSRGNVFAFGIGSSVNRYLIEGLAEAGQGDSFVVSNPQEAESKSRAFEQYVSAPVLSGIRVRFDGIEAYDIEPKSFPDLLAERPLIISGKFKGTKGSLTVEGRSAEGNYRRTLDFSESKNLPKAALGRLWARKRIAALGDYGTVDGEAVEEITSLSLTYKVLSPYTSFVAVEEQRATTAKWIQVIQPLPLPLGVTEQAVGGTDGAEVGYVDSSGHDVSYAGGSNFPEYQETDVRTAVSLILRLIEGGVGALIMVLCLFLAVFALLIKNGAGRRRLKLAGLFFTAAVGVFALRALAALLFGGFENLSGI